jgi:prephenate dehydrogenase
MKVAIIGGSGKMGRWFANFLLKEGMEVILSARNEKKLINLKESLKVQIAFKNAEAIKNADIILISVPIDSFEGVVKEISPFVTSNQIILDITSIKELPVEIMHEYIKKGTILGTHPVFGPDVENASNQNFILTPITPKEETLAAKFEKWLSKRGFNVIKMSPQKHDELMSVILGFSHFVGIAICDTLLSLENFEEIKGANGTSFKILLTFARKVISEDPEFYAALQMNLPNVVGVEQLFCEKAKVWAEVVRNKDREKFVFGMRDLGEKSESKSE